METILQEINDRWNIIFSILGKYVALLSIKIIYINNESDLFFIYQCDSFLPCVWSIQKQEMQ